MKNHVLICVPTYNNQGGLSLCLESLLQQTYTDFTILIGDNHSEDTTKEFCKNFIKDKDNIFYIQRMRNQGSYWNFLNLITFCPLYEAKYFLFASDDYIYEKDFLARAINVLINDDKEEIVSCITQIRRSRTDGTIVDTKDDLDLMFDDPILRIRKMIWNDKNGLIFTGLHRYSKFENVKSLWQNLNINVLTDLEFFTHCLVNGKVFQINESLIKRSDLHTAKKSHEHYTTYLLRHHYAHQYRQYLNLPFCNGMTKVCMYFLLNENIKNPESYIETTIKELDMVFKKHINDEIQLVQTHIDGLIVEQLSSLECVMLRKFKLDVDACLVFYKNENLKKISARLLEIC